MYGQDFQQSMNQPGKVANPARGQLNRKTSCFSCSRSRLIIWSRETGSAVPSRVRPPILNSQSDGIPPDFRGGFHLFIYSTAIRRHRASPEFIGPRNCVPMAFTAESRPSAGTGSVVLKVVRVAGTAFSGITIDQLLCALPLCSTPPAGICTRRTICGTESTRGCGEPSKTQGGKKQRRVILQYWRVKWVVCITPVQ